MPRGAAWWASASGHQLDHFVPFHARALRLLVNLFVSYLKFTILSWRQQYARQLISSTSKKPSSTAPRHRCSTQELPILIPSLTSLPLWSLSDLILLIWYLRVFGQVSPTEFSASYNGTGHGKRFPRVSEQERLGLRTSRGCDEPSQSGGGGRSWFHGPQMKTRQEQQRLQAPR